MINKKVTIDPSTGSDAGFYSRANKEAAEQIRRGVCVDPNRSTRSEERRELEKRRCSDGQKWRTGWEARIIILKRCHGLARCLYLGVAGMRRRVRLGVIADNLINIGRRLVEVGG